MKKVMSGIISLLMICAIAFTSFPVFASDDTIEKASCETTLYENYGYISITNTCDYDYACLEKKNDDGTWSEISTGTYFYVECVAKKVTYYRVRLCREVFNDITYEYNYNYGEYSDEIMVYSKLSQTSYSYQDSSNTKLKLCISPYDYYKSYIDGYKVDVSINGGSYQSVGNISLSSTKSTYSISKSYTTSFARSIIFRYRPYFVYDSVTYYGDYEYSNTESYINTDKLKMTTKASTINLSWPSVSGVKEYRVYYTPYKLSTRKKSSKKSKVVTTNSASISNTAKTYGCNVYLKITFKNGATVSTYSQDSNSGLPLMKGAAKSKLTNIKVVNTRGSKTKTAWTFKVSSADKKIIKEFCNKHFANKNYSRAQKAEYVLNWINKNVTYASGSKYSKIANKTYVQAIFKYKLGQCLQYNGAYAEFLVYLGYNARVIEGYRRSSSGSKINHFWCEVKIHDRWYCMETGNYKKNGYWQHFCEQYYTSSGYTRNGKLIKYM